MRIYLAGGMRGYPELNYPSFHKAAAELRVAGNFVFNPAETSAIDADIRACMAIDVAWICAQADAVALLPGWETSRGARAEHALAEALGLEIIEL